MRNKKCWNFDFFRRTMPLGIAIACAAFVCTAQEPATSDVKEVTDPNAYSTGTMSAAEINQWYKANIKPEDFDIWNGKKDRTDLNGSWKFMQLQVPITRTYTYDGIGGFAFDADESDFGEKHGFFKKDFDDSKWFNLLVPYAWIYKFNPDPNQPGGYVKGGNPYDKAGSKVALGWYRRDFTVPESKRGERILLTFRAVTYKATVYVNGVEVGGHEENCKPYHWIAATAHGEEQFSIDISKLIDFGKDNKLAVKVFAPCMNGGIWQEVYLETVPQIYCEKALITPDLDGKQAKVKAYLVNTTEKAAKIVPSITLAPWKSERYTLADWKAETVKLAEMNLKSGRNEIDFTVPVKEAHLWSPEHPNLYHFTMKNGETIMGQERFGFRTFMVGKKLFDLNGKPIFLRSEDMFPCARVMPGDFQTIQKLGLLNRDGMMDKTVSTYLKAGFNYYRSQSTTPPHLFYDIADEQGLIMSDEETYLKFHHGVKSVQDGIAELTPGFKEAIRARCFESYNHPSLVTRSCGNEQYDIQTGEIHMLKETGWAPMLSAIYDEYKKHDPTRPITSSSGRGPTNFGKDDGYPVTLRRAKGDFDDVHPYITDRNHKNAEYEDCYLAYKKIKDAYTRDNGGIERVMMNGESSEFYTFAPDQGLGNAVFERRVKDFTPHLKDGEFDREWLAQNFKTLDHKYLTEACEFSLIPYNVSVNTDANLRVQARHNKMLMEMMRRKREWLAGYVLHQPVIFRSRVGETFPHTFESARMAQQPVLACLSGLFNRNMIGGKSQATEIFLINDSESLLENPRVTVLFTPEGGAAPVKIGAYNAGCVEIAGIRVIPVALTIPSDTATCSGVIKLEVEDKGKPLGSNEYEVKVLSPSNMKLLVNPAAVSVYAPEGADVIVLTDILKDLGVTFKSVNEFSQLTPESGVLLLPPETYKKGVGDESLIAWVNKGGKIVAFEQKNIPPLIRGRTGPSGVFGWWTELVLRAHPIFNGLKQEDFYFWSGNSANKNSMKLATDGILPLNKGALAMGLMPNYHMGMSVCEVRVGLGRALFSQLGALKRYGEDSVATQYTLNLLNYVLGDFNHSAAPVLSQTEERTVYKPDPAKTFSVDLRGNANMAFADEIEGDGKGGWSDQGPDNDARLIPLGKQTFAGVSFDLIDPAKNKGKSCLVLQGSEQTKTAFLPLEIKNISVHRTAKKFYFLVTAPWCSGTQTIGAIKINMISGSRAMGTVSVNTIELIPGKNIADWQKPHDLPEALVGWSATGGKGTQIHEGGVYVIEWINPEPQVEIGSIDFSSTGRAVPILIAISGESDSPIAAVEKQPSIVQNTTGASTTGSNFSAGFKSTGNLCVLRSGELETVISKSYASVQIGKNKFAVSIGNSTVEAFDLISEGPDSKVLRRTSAPYESEGGVVQSVIDYEIRKGLPVLFVRSKLYNRDNGIPSKCYAVWSFPVIQPIMASSEGDVSLNQPWSKLPNAKDWVYYENAEKTGGLGIVTDGLEGKQRKIMANSSMKDWKETKKACWDICVNHEKEGPLFAAGEYSCINLAIFPSQSKEECSAMFKKISSNEWVGLWKY